MNLRERSILAVAKQLHHDKVSKALSVRAAKAFSTISLACSGSGSKDAAAMDRYRKRADTNWWAAIHAFATADEVQKAAFNDPRHVHLLIYVAPSWCGWSQKQLKELQENFDDLGEAQARVHLIDVDDPANKDLVQFQGVTSFPTIVVVQGNNILGKASGYKTFNTVHDIAFVDNDGKSLLRSSSLPLSVVYVSLPPRPHALFSQHAMTPGRIRSLSPSSSRIYILSSWYSYLSPLFLVLRCSQLKRGVDEVVDEVAHEIARGNALAGATTLAWQQPGISNSAGICP
jgi:thiol-disulfide isomerase/thioredoxin